MLGSESPALPPGPLPAEYPRLRRFLLACGLATLAVGTLAPLLAPPKTEILLTWLQTTIVPAAILVLLFANPRGRLRLLAAICALLYLEAVLTAALYTIGIAFSILLPIMGIGLVQPHISGRAAIAVYAGAAVTSTVSVALFALSVPSNPLDEPGLAVVGFGFLAVFALGLIWRAGVRTTTALDAAQREIGARSQAEAALADTVRILETMLRSSPVATLAVDADGIVRVWNPAAERVFGWTEADIVGRQLGDGIGGAGGMELVEALARTFGGAVLNGEAIHTRRRDGRELIVEVHAASTFDRENRAVGTIAQMTDITDRSALESQLRQAQKMEAVGQLAGGIAHDINNTLTAVGGFAELIETATEDPAIREDARTISAAVQRGGRLTRQLLAFARRSILQPQTVEVTGFVSSIEPMLGRLLGSDVIVSVRHEIAAGRIRVDPGQLEQAILNLAVNSRDAMPAGGRVTIATRREANDDAKTADGRSSIVISVSDTGPGIAPSIQDQVFEPFFTTKERGKGTGLGLAMVYGFVRQSGGNVVLESTVGQGTSVEISLPEVVDAPLAADRAGVDQASPGDETILVVEDEEPVARLARQILVRLGYRVLLAKRPAEAIELATAHDGPIRLVVSDVIMPGMLGPAVAERIRELHPEARVLYVSGYTADAVADRGILPPGVDLVEKPYTAVELGRRVRAVLDRPADPGPR